MRFPVVWVAAGVSARFGVVDRGRPGEATRRRSRRRIATFRPVLEEPILRYRPDGPCPRWLARQVGQLRSGPWQPTDTTPGSSSAPRYGRPGVTTVRRSKGTSLHRGRRARAVRGATGGGRSRRESRDGGWRRSASSTPTESTRARTSCSGCEIQAAQRSASRGVNRCQIVPIGAWVGCRGAADERAEIRKPLPSKELAKTGLRVQFPPPSAEPSGSRSMSQRPERPPGTSWTSKPCGSPSSACEHVTHALDESSVASARAVGTILVLFVAMRPQRKPSPVAGQNVRIPLFSNGLQRIPSTRQVPTWGSRVRFRS
jgi:hypothetical protein